LAVLVGGTRTLDLILIRYGGLGQRTPAITAASGFLAGFALLLDDSVCDPC